MFCIVDMAWGCDSFTLPNAGNRNVLCPCFYQSWRHNVSSIVRIRCEKNRNSEKTRRRQDLCLTFHLLRQLERDQRHHTGSATLVVLSPPDLPPKTEQSIEPVQRNRQRGSVGPFHDHFGGSVVSEKCSTGFGFDNQASVVQVISVSKEMRMGWNHTVPANDRVFYWNLSERSDCWNWFAWKWNTETFISHVC